MVVPCDITVVVATRNRRVQLLSTLARHEASVIVVDNASTDGTSQAVRHAYPAIKVIDMPVNAGAAARNVGVRYAGSRYVAFADDDSYWAAGALRRAVQLLDASPRTGLLTARVLVGEEARIDPTSVAMRDAPLGLDADLPGPSVLGFLGCAAIVRRDAFWSVGGFNERLGIYGEEQLLAWDLAAAGWGLVYIDDLVVCHHPLPAGRSPVARQVQQERNGLLTALLRRRPAAIGRRCGSLIRTDTGRRALVRALRELPWVLRARRANQAWLETRIEMLEGDA